MIILINIYKLFIRFVYIFMKMFKTDNKKVVFISRQSNSPSLDFLMIADKLKEEDEKIKVVFLCKRISNGLIGKIKYSFCAYEQMYHLATSKVCIVDSFCIPVSNLKHKKSLYIIQLWHAIGKIKKSGYQTLGMSSGRNASIAKALNMHKNYDAVIAGGEAFNTFYEKTFNINKEIILNYGLPRIDYMINNEKKIKSEILKKYPEFKNRKVILYLPTFRTYDISIEDLTKNYDKDECILIVKSHPNQCLKIADDVYTCDDYKSIDLLTIADYVITDYSSMSLEAAVLNKKVLFYLFDYDEYISNNGINLDPMKVLKSCSFKNAKKLIDVINKDNYDDKEYQKFRKKYLPEDLGNSTLKITDLIISKLN